MDQQDALDEQGDPQFAKETHDVLEAHHKKNRRPKAPEPEKLAAIREIGIASNDDAMVSDVDESASDESASEAEEAEDSGPQRAPRHSKTPYGSKLRNYTKINAYPVNWRDLLEDTSSATMQARRPIGPSLVAK